jgi:hypothetical protein
MVASDEIKNFKKLKLFVEFNFIYIENFKFVEDKIFFIIIQSFNFAVHSAAHFVAPWTLLLGAALTSPPPPHSS